MTKMGASEVPPPGRYGPREVGLLAATSIVWGAAYVFIRQGLVFGAAPLAFASARYLLSAAAFAILAAARREALPSRRDLLVSAGIGGTLIIGLYGGFLYWGEQYTTGGYAAVLASTAPLMTVAVGFSLLSAERLGRRGLLGMGVGFVGATVLVVPELTGIDALGSWEGPPFILMAIASTAVGTVLLRRLGRGRQGLWQIGSQFTVAGTMLGAAALVIPGGRTLPLTAGVLEMLGILVAFSSIIGYFAYFALHHRVGPVRANVVAYIAPLVGVAVGTGAYGEMLTAWEIVGVVVVLSGVGLVLLDSARRTPVAPASPRPTPRGD